MSSSNLGRVQGGGFFGSSSTSTESIEKTTVQTNGVFPLVGDTIVNANGDLCKITAIKSTEYTVSKYGSIRGPGPDLSIYYTIQQTKEAIDTAIENAITTVLNTPV